MSESIMKSWNLWSKVEGVLGKEHLIEITNAAISYMKQHPGKTALEEIVGRIKIDGFRQFLYAPQNRQVREIVSRVEQDKTMKKLLLIVEMWVKVEINLYQEMMKNLVASPNEWGEIRQKVDNDEVVEINEAIFNLASHLTLSADYKERDITLMICYILSEKLERLDVEEMEKQAEEMETQEIQIEENIEYEVCEELTSEAVSDDAHVIWDKWAEKLENLPADAVEWARLDEFIEKIRQIGNEKQHIREQCAIRNQLIATVVENISKANESYSLELDFFDISICDSDKLDQLTEFEIGQLEEAIVDLELYFETYRELKQRPIHKAIEEQQTFKEINEVSQKIFALGKMLVGCEFEPEKS